MTHEFEAFKKIARYKGEVQVTVTEKIHGTNAQVLIYLDENGETQIKAGSRTRWLTPEHDNFGFAAWVEDNKQALIDFLGYGRHYGEWYGAGVNHGYGLKEKRFALFNTGRWKPLIDQGVKVLPERVDLVPIVYQGTYHPNTIKECLDKLKKDGSVMVPGCMKAEGVVVYYHDFDALRKSVIDPEETGWRGVPGSKNPKERKSQEEMFESVAEYLQPIRLEKLLSRDSTYTDAYPSTLPKIVGAYLQDLQDECSVPTEKVQEVKKVIYKWVKSEVEKE